MSVFLRTIVYATFFIGFLLIWLPARLLAAAGIHRPATIGTPQIAGLSLCVLGALLALSCVAAFVWLGKGTPAPFDAPRRLVVRGPYRVIRNPMYLGAGMALAAAALFYRSAALLAYAAIFLLVFHCFVLFYEEPTLRRVFGVAYEEYCRRTGRWWPRLDAGSQ
jgi:protein-S-isoprenylcysteine O-methyltransferase Ste14